MPALLLPALLALPGMPAFPSLPDPAFPDDAFMDTGFVDPTFVDPAYPGSDTGVDGVVGLFWVLFVVGAVVAVAIGIRRLAAYHRHGIDPTTVDVDLAARVLRSEALAPPSAATPTASGGDEPPAEGARAPRSVEERLAELDRLHRAGVISDDEHRDARADVLRDV